MSELKLRASFDEIAGKGLERGRYTRVAGSGRE
jgi:hypothetical protein